MSTFEQIAARADELQDHAAPSLTSARLNRVLALVEEMAKAMQRLEYNTAVQLAAKGLRVTPDAEVLQLMINNFVQCLRFEIPEGVR